MKEEMDLVAKTFQGLEDVLAEELARLGAADVKPGRRMVAFRGDKELLYKANLCCRTALRILKPFYTFGAFDADELYEQAKQYEWDKLLTADQTFAIDSTVNSEGFRHSKFVTYRVKDAIADFFMEKYGKRPSIRLNGADVLLNVHINNDEVTISLDSSGEPLYKRGYRVAQTEAPINEVLAAGLILKTGWKGDSNFVDPMCGSGTFLIEAALIAANINPGIYRSEFAFERWPDYDAELFESLYNDDSAEREFTYKIYGSDISPKAIAIAEQNIKSAGVGRMIDLQVKPFQRYETAPEKGILITNPPYGERIAADDMDALYESIGERLKKVFRGYHAWILGYRSEYFDKIGLKPSVKFPVFNGALECEFREYVIFDGTYAEFRKEGHSIKDEHRAPRTFRRDDDRKEKRFGQDDRRSDRRPFKRNDDKEGHREPKVFRRNDDKPTERFERDRRGVLRERPKNALEEKYRRPYNDRKKTFGDEGRKDDRFKKDDRKRTFRDDRKDSRFDRKENRFESRDRREKPARNEERTHVFSDKKVQDAVRFRQPKLFDDVKQGEVTMRHRRKTDETEKTED